MNHKVCISYKDKEVVMPVDEFEKILNFARFQLLHAKSVEGFLPPLEVRALSSIHSIQFHLDLT